jgi:hypothetical protein
MAQLSYEYNDGARQPLGWPAFVSSGRSQGHDNSFCSTSRNGLFDSEQLIGDLAGVGMGTMQSGTRQGLASGVQKESPRLRRPETPILAYVDRASMPGFVDSDERECHYQQLELQQQVPAQPTHTITQVSSLDEWEAELAEWKRRYGCPDAPPLDQPSAAGADADRTQLVPVIPAETTTATVEPKAGDMVGQSASSVMSEIPLRTDTSEGAAQVSPSESMLNTDVDIAELEPAAQNPVIDLPERQSPLQPHATATILQNALTETPGACLRKEADAVDQFQREGRASPTELARAQEQAQALTDEINALRGEDIAACTDLIPSAPLLPRPPSEPQDTSRPATAGRRLEYTPQDLELAAESAKQRVQADGSWKGEYSETGLQKRDFFGDIRKQREKDKGRQATGPLWIHLATQAKNLAYAFDLAELVEALKLFASVRFEDYELYMRLLGEVPHYVTQASSLQLCELVRILARRRLRERNYVDMAAAHLMHKIRATDDVLPPRQLVKAANAFAALECRSNPKFVEHFLRHFEHRIRELDASLCCLVSPVFVDQYMNDALRRAYLVRCAETHAGFQGALEDARNIACTELLLRKEHHSLVVSLPPHVHRYLDKVQRHAQFDKWGAVTLPTSSLPDGPKGNTRAEMNFSLQLKASTAEGAGKQADVFSSDMHRDISACLSHLGVDHENGVIAGPYLLDIVAQDMVTPSKKIVYEVNSPHHYFEGTEQLTPDKRLRHRMINRLGHKLHMVNAAEWKKLSAARKMAQMLKMQQAQQDENANEEKQKAAATTSRAPLPAIPIGQTTRTDPLKLKSISDLRQPIRIPVPPSQRTRQPVSAR